MGTSIKALTVVLVIIGAGALGGCVGYLPITGEKLSGIDNVPEGSLGLLLGKSVTQIRNYFSPYEPWWSLHETNKEYLIYHQQKEHGFVFMAAPGGSAGEYVDDKTTCVKLTFDSVNGLESHETKVTEQDELELSPFTNRPFDCRLAFWTREELAALKDHYAEAAEKGDELASKILRSDFNVVILGKEPATKSLAQNIGLEGYGGWSDYGHYWSRSFGFKADHFRSELQSALDTTGLLRGPSGENEYKLAAKILNIESPPFGGNMTVTSEIRYKLTQSRSDKAVFDEIILSSHTAKFTESFWAVSRVKAAYEGALHKSIKQLIESLYLLELDQDLPDKPMARVEATTVEQGEWSLHVEQLAASHGCSRNGVAELLSEEGVLQIYRQKCTNMADRIYECEYSNCSLRQR